MIYMEMSTTNTRTAGAESVSAIFIFVSAIFDFVSAKIQNGSAKIWLFDVEISLRARYRPSRYFADTTRRDFDARA